MQSLDEPEAYPNEEYRRLYEELGGPMPILVRPDMLRYSDEADRRRAYDYIDDSPLTRAICTHFPFAELRDWALPDYKEEDQIKAWPWVATFAMEYGWMAQNFHRSQDLSATEAKELLVRVKENLESVAKDISRLEAAARMPRPMSRGEGFRRIFYRLAVGKISESRWRSVAPGPAALQEWTLAEVLAGMALESEALALVLDAGSEAFKASSERLPGLNKMVFYAGRLWEDFQGKPPSASKVYRKDGTTDPPFVIFVQDIAAYGGAPVPTRKQVEVALKAEWEPSPFPFPSKTTPNAS
jgi:hypothetical protein